MSLSDPTGVAELCHRLHRETSANAVLVCGPEGEIIAWAGAVGRIDDELADAIGDATALVLCGAPDAEGQVIGDGEELLRKVGAEHLVAAPLGNRALLAVTFDDESRLQLVRLRMKRARELILRSLEAG